jgi:hypothetical protein
MAMDDSPGIIIYGILFCETQSWPNIRSRYSAQKARENEKTVAIPRKG